MEGVEENMKKTNLSEITRVILIKKGSVMMLATSITTTTGMCSMLANTTITSGHVASLLSVVV